MSSIVFRLALGGLALYLYVQGNIFGAVVCALVVVWLSFQQRLARIIGVLGRLGSLPDEHNANSVLAYSFRLDRVFEHRTVDELFAKLQKNGKAPAAAIEDAPASRHRRHPNSPLELVLHRRPLGRRGVRHHWASVRRRG